MMIASFYRCHAIQQQQMILFAIARTLEKLANHRTHVARRKPYWSSGPICAKNSSVRRGGGRRQRLTWLIYGESLTNLQWFGIGLIPIGVACAGISAV
jgi:hypothetical protein